MTGEELKDTVYYNGQYRAMRQLCIDRDIIPVEELALMDTSDVCKVIAEHFELLGVRDEGQTILLVEKDKWDEVMKNVVPLYR